MARQIESFHDETFVGERIRTLAACRRRIQRIFSPEWMEGVSGYPQGYEVSPITAADAWVELANAYADEAGEPHPEFKFLPKGSKPVDELWDAANQIERDREKLEAQIGEYAYAMRAAVAWGNLAEALT